MERSVLTVTELNRSIKGALSTAPYLRNIWVSGEIGGCTLNRSGHLYFTIKDKESALDCVMFRSAAGHLRFRPETGMQVLAAGSVDFYQTGGRTQLLCTALQPAGVGDLAVAFEQLREKLAAEGLFDAARKKPLPAYPHRIALITSATGAAVHDMLRILRRRWPLATVKIMGVSVQGAQAAPQIVGALRYANRWQLADLIITGRGGGSMEDLWCFNDERVARAIAESQIPVISAVGHEPDVTIADFAADLRAATPSNGAELAAPDQADLRERLEACRTKLQMSLTGRIETERSRLRLLARSRVLNDPAAYVHERMLTLDGLSGALTAAMEKNIAARRLACSRLAAGLDALSPLKVLSRGYSMTRKEDGSLLQSVRELAPGQLVQLYLRDGCATAEIRTVEEQDHAGTGTEVTDL